MSVCPIGTEVVFGENFNTSNEILHNSTVNGTASERSVTELELLNKTALALLVVGLALLTGILTWLLVICLGRMEYRVEEDVKDCHVPELNFGDSLSSCSTPSPRPLTTGDSKSDQLSADVALEFQIRSMYSYLESQVMD